LHDDVQAYREKTLAASLLKTQPQAGKILSEKKDDVLGVTEFVLSNGIKVVVKSTDFKNDEIVFNSFRKGGLAIYKAEDKYSATYATSAVSQMGFGDFSPTDLRKFLAGKIANVSPRIGGLTSGFGGNSSVKDVETLFQLIYLCATQPRLDKSLFDAWVQKQKAGTQFILADPQTSFVDTFYNVLYQNNPLSSIAIPKPDYFDKINLERAMAIYKEQIQNQVGATFIFTGSIDINKMKPLIETYIASLPVRGNGLEFVDNGVRTIKGNQYLKANKGKEKKSLILNYYSGDVEYSYDLALKAQALSEILNIKIIEDLREKMGGIYGGGIFGGVNKYPYSNYTFFLQLPCGPENVEKLQIAAAAEIDTIKMQGPQQKDLDKVKKTWLEKYKVNIKENGFWLGKLQGIYMMGDKALEIFDYEKNVNAITVDDIKKTANLLLNGKNVFKAELYPEK
jgi:zinc protease